LDCEELYIYLPENVTYTPSFLAPPNGNEVKGITLSFGNFTGGHSFEANITYWQEIPPVEDVEIDYYNLTLTNFGNGTWMVAHTIIVKNNSNDTLVIPTLDYDGFANNYVIRNSTNLYWNGNLSPWGDLIGETTMNIETFISPRTTLNVTVTYLTTQQPF
jgi:hypothetical protein